MPIKNRLIYSGITILVLLLVAAGYYLVKSPQSPIKSAQFVDRSVVFSGSKNVEGSTSVYVLDKDGNVTELAPSGYTNELDATFSPDLKKIAFVATHDSQEVIAVMNSDGSSPEVVSKLAGPKTMPSWSSDGKKIIYALATSEGGVAEIDIAAGTDKVVSVGTNNLQTPSWLPDGSGFSFVAVAVDQNAGSMKTQFEIYKGGTASVVAVSAEKGVALGDLASPAVSPDGKDLVFARSSDNMIYTSKVDGSALRLLTKPKDSIFSCPSWSSDGSFVLATESDTSGKNYISRIDLNNGAVTRAAVSGFAKIICPREARY